MPNKINQKNSNLTKELEKQIASVLVMNNTDLKPYVELFEHHPENVYQQPLGSLVGFFEITDYSEDSAYVVNFLMSVLKKEYYANPKRPVAESFDSALHKVNVALSELAKHKNINWLGKLDAAVCVIEKSSIHFSVTGSGHLFIFRNQYLTDISEGLAPDTSDPHPLKTFVDVSSGRIEEADKLLLFSDDLFQVLPLAQLKKNLTRFSPEDFAQFIRTALTNELEMTAALIIDVSASQQPKAKSLNAVKNPVSNFNAFSEKTYSSKKPAKISAQPIAEKTLPENGRGSEKDYTDQKTGHIYVQGEGGSEESSRFGLFWEIAKENLAEAAFRARSATKKKLVSTKKDLTQAARSGKEKLKVALENAQEKSRQRAEARAAEKAERQKKQAELEARQKAEQAKLAEELDNKRREQEVLDRQAKQSEKKLVAKQLESEMAPGESAAVLSPKEALARPATKIPEPAAPAGSLSLQQKIERMRQELEAGVRSQGEEAAGTQPISTPELDRRIEKLMSRKKESSSAVLTAPVVETAGVSQESSPLNEEESAVRVFFEKIPLAGKKAFALISTKLQNFGFSQKKSNLASALKKSASLATPHFSKISALFERLTKKQKVAALGILLFILVAPLIMAKISAPKKSAPVAPAPTPPTLSETLAGEKNISLSAKTALLSSQTGGVAVVAYGGDPYLISAQKIVAVSGGNAKEYAWPTDAGQAIDATLMADLKLIFILTDQQKILSFSPISQQFSNNNISLPPGAKLKFLATYLTYLYLPDSQANQIYRYPRATGGFGDKTDWYKDTLSLADASAMTIDDSVYFVIDNKVVKLFKGKNQNLDFEDSKTPIVYDRIFTNSDSQSFYVLDAQNARLVRYDKNGALQNQTFNENLKGATAFSVDEAGQTAFLATPTGLLSLAL